MGFKLVRKGYALKFADGSPLDGATVVMSGLSVGQVVKAREQMRAAQGDQGPEAKADGILQTLATLAENLVSWDLEEEDETPIPANEDGVMSLELPVAFSIFHAWMGAVSTVDTPLPNASSDGETHPLEASIPMEALPTTSQAS